MSPNQPKTPVSNFRLDDETKARIRRISEQMGTTMTGALKRMAEDAESASGAMAELVKEPAQKAAEAAERFRRARAEDRHERSEQAVHALAAALIDRDWPEATPRQRYGHHAKTYNIRAAAILNGEAWAIRATWPEAAYEIQTRSDWS
jgi:antitoxin component of RelBE/YafQ-DinJ toxin-antitoxin module